MKRCLLFILALWAEGAFAEQYLQKASECARVRWQSDNYYAYLTLENNCDEKVYADIKVSNGSRDLFECSSNKTCKSSHPKSDANYSFEYCISYTNYELQKHFGSCRLR